MIINVKIDKLKPIRISSSNGVVMPYAKDFTHNLVTLGKEDWEDVLYEVLGLQDELLLPANTLLQVAHAKGGIYSVAITYTVLKLLEVLADVESRVIDGRLSIYSKSHLFYSPEEIADEVGVHVDSLEPLAETRDLLLRNSKGDLYVNPEYRLSWFLTEYGLITIDNPSDVL